MEQGQIDLVLDESGVSVVSLRGEHDLHTLPSIRERIARRRVTARAEAIERAGARATSA